MSSNNLKRKQQSSDSPSPIIPNKKRKVLDDDWIKHKDVYNSAMIELSNMVGISDTIDAIKDYIHVINNEKRFNIKTSNDHMQHIMILGDSGTGKTTLSKILAKLLWSLGLLESDVKTIEVSDVEKYKSCIDDLSMLLKFKNLNIDRLNDDIKTLTYIADSFQHEMSVIHQCIEKYLWHYNKVVNKRSSHKYKLDDITYYLNIFKTIYYNRLENYKDICFFNNNLSASTQDNGILNFEIIKSKLNNTPVPTSQTENKKSINIDDIYVIADRSNLIAKYVGQTAIKTKEFLDKHRGKVIFIDEAYQLFQDGRDWFGTEALTTINTYMSEYPKNYIFIFAGYSNEMMSSIFKSQQGIERRISKIFNLSKPTHYGLFTIFKSQLDKAGYTVTNDSIDIFKTHYDIFKHSGGSTLKLIPFVRSEYWKTKVNIKNKPSMCITPVILNKAIESMLKMSTTCDDKPPENMYN